MTTTASKTRTVTITRRQTARFFPLEEVPVTLLGESADWFTIVREGNGVIVSPVQPLPKRCTIRPAALFDQQRGFPDANTVMGRMIFAHGATRAQRYQPFTCDPHRRLRELFLPVEAMPEDDWPASPTRWRNWEAVARRLCLAAEVPWTGLTEDEVETLVQFVSWPEPLEGCLLHALVQHAHPRGDCVIEIGSYRGRSISMLALALRGVGSDMPLISIDPHACEPTNAEHVRLALAQIGEEQRLVHFPCTSDEASRLLRPGCAALVFIDGDHSYKSVVADFTRYREILAPGGIMVFHDYGYGTHNGLPEADPEVRQAVDEHVVKSDGLEPLLLAHTQFAFIKASG